MPELPMEEQDSEMAGGTGDSMTWDSNFQAEPIRVIPSFNMDLDNPFSIIAERKRTHDKNPSLIIHRKRLRVWSHQQPASTVATPVQQALLIDLIVSHIIGYLPWRQQLQSCCRVSKLWNQAAITAPMRVLIIGNDANTQQALPRVLAPCLLERSLNELSWNTLCKMPHIMALRKITRLDIFGTLDLEQGAPLFNHCRRSHLEELSIRYTSIDALFQMFPLSTESRFLSLKKLAIQERDTTKYIYMEKKTDLLERWVNHHAPNLVFLQACLDDERKEQ